MDWLFVAFIAFSTLAVVSSAMVVMKKNPVSAAFSLITVLLSFAGIYAILGAHFVAALQILIYTGAIMVLFVFVIMLLNTDEIEDDLAQSSMLLKSIISLGLFALGSVLVQAILSADEIKPTGVLSAEKIKEAGGSVQVIAEALFSNYVFHFELLSFLILGAIVATIALAKRKSKSSEGVAE